MTLFRHKTITRFLTTLTAVVFLNLSFFLTEITIINLKSNNQELYQSLVKTFFSICEEENDSNGNETSENETLSKIDGILINSPANLPGGYSIILGNNTFFNPSSPSDGTLLSINQPPEV